MAAIGSFGDDSEGLMSATDITATTVTATPARDAPFPIEEALPGLQFVAYRSSLAISDSKEVWNIRKWLLSLNH